MSGVVDRPHLFPDRIRKPHSGDDPVGMGIFYAAARRSSHHRRSGASEQATEATGNSAPFVTGR